MILAITNNIIIRVYEAKYGIKKMNNIMPRGMGGSTNFINYKPYNWKQFLKQRQYKNIFYYYTYYYAKLCGII